MNTTFTTSPVSASSARPNNLTRRTANLTRKFWRNGQWHLIPLYHFLRLSDLAREGIERSGSFRFADHLYRNQASGRYGVGKFLDRLVLNSRAARAMGTRCAQASLHLERALDASDGPFTVMTVPSGIPRDVSDLIRRRADLAPRIEYIGMDLDPIVIEAGKAHLQTEAPQLMSKATWLHGNALVDLDYPVQPVDCILSTGLGEFLDDVQLRQFYQNVFATLAPDGCFFTSATRREPGSDYLLRAFELETQYRTEEKLRGFFAELPWSSVEFHQDATGLQTFAWACK